MYEFRQGSKRLANALKNVSDNDIKRLSDILNYVPSQLKEDIQALNDVVNTHFEDGED